MEDIIAVEVKLGSGGVRYFLTWGRVQDTVDPTPVEELVLRESSRFDLRGKAVSARLCRSLQEAASQPYFFESFFAMCRVSTVFGPDYEDWRSRTNRAMLDGSELYFLGVADA